MSRNAKQLPELNEHRAYPLDSPGAWPAACSGNRETGQKLIPPEKGTNDMSDSAKAVTLRLDRALIDGLKTLAAKDRRSFNTFIEMILMDHLHRVLGKVPDPEAK